MSFESEDSHRKNVRIPDDLQNELDTLTNLSELSESEIFRLGLLLASDCIESIPSRYLSRKHKTRNAIANSYEWNLTNDQIDSSVFQ